MARRSTTASAAPVDGVDGADEQAFALAAVDQFNGAVVLESQALGNIGDGDGGGCGCAGHLEKKLVLLGL